MTKNPFKDAPAVPAHSCTGTAHAGTQRAKLVPCTRSKHHSFHPEDEECPDCPRGTIFSTPDQSGVSEIKYWYASARDGSLVDSRLFSSVKSDLTYMRLDHINRGTTLSELVCGCRRSLGPRVTIRDQPCRKYIDDRGIPIEAHRMPSVVKDPKWRRV